MHIYSSSCILLVLLERIKQKMGHILRGESDGKEEKKNKPAYYDARRYRSR